MSESKWADPTWTGPMVVEVDTDDLTADQKSALEALGVPSDVLVEEPEEVFDSIDAVAQRETEEKAGRWFKVPFLKGAEVKVAHSSAAKNRLFRLESKWRASHGKGPGENLSTEIWLRLVRDAYFGTVVTAWRGIRLGSGEELPFTESNYQKVWEVRRFSDWVLETARQEDNFRAKIEEGIRGNS